MITDIFDGDVVRILTLFSISPGSKHTRNEIKEKTMLNNLPLDNALSNLVKNKILVRERRLFGLNFENRLSKEVLEIIKKEHLRFREIPLDVYFALVDLSSQFSNIKIISRAFLFGSFAKMIYTNKSDMDIALFLQNEDKGAIAKIKSGIGKLEKKFHRAIELHFFIIKDLKAKDPLIKEIVKNGIEVY